MFCIKIMAMKQEAKSPFLQIFQICCFAKLNCDEMHHMSAKSLPRKFFRSKKQNLPMIVNYLTFKLAYERRFMLLSGKIMRKMPRHNDH
mmetsp:Transcript_38585/g.46560  ORF Transcript_38585/g.46560 Transcript_38585/m.46560 type:complete len:89 (+) Transcript_38585:282-548(+)